MAKFKKTLIVSLAALLAASSVVGLAACGQGEDDDGGKGGNTKLTTLQFWGSGDADELKVFGNIVKEFNKTIGAEKKIKVEYSGNHEDPGNNALQLSGNNPPDVIYVPDRHLKSWVSAGYLENLTNPDGSAKYDGLEEFTAPGKIWDQGIQRYRFDIATATSTPTSVLWALPKDSGPTVLYYNREYMEEMGIEHISLDPTDAEFVSKGYPEKGYFQHTDGKWYFNNRVPMSWDETTTLAMKMQKEVDACKYGYFTEWWFNYGWSIGGDCVEYVPEGNDADGNPMGYYEFTLNDTTVNWIVKDDCKEAVKVNGNEYKAGEIISYTDKKALTEAQKQNYNQLPSMKDAFIEFAALTAPETELAGVTSKGVEVYGKSVSMGQESIGAQSARDRFSAGSFGMFVGGRWEVTHLRKKIGTAGSWMKDNESWDVAPLPVYKEYDADGNITVHGVQAGHSGSMGLAIARGSKKKQAAWELVKYIAGTPGQTSQAEAGFCIPNQIDIAKTDVFLQPTQAPLNAQVFVDAAQYETPGDWWYLKDADWIDDWANCLNNEVREPNSQNHKTVDELFSLWGASTQTALYKYTYSSKNLAAKPKNN